MKTNSGSMKVGHVRIHLETEGFCDIHNITDEGQREVQKSGIEQGTATFFVIDSTAALTTVEYEPGLVKDLKNFFDRIIPRDDDYHHEETWHDGNGFSHIRASLLKPSLPVPIVDSSLLLGTWQQIILIDFDNTPRRREVALQVMGI